MKREDCELKITPQGDIVDCDENIEALRSLWIGRTLIDGEDLGPGDRGDFDNGAWHVSCHLVAAGGVCRSADGQLLWLEISHDSFSDLYFASITVEIDGRVTTHALDSPQGRALLKEASRLGFVEGNSTGHTSAKNAKDTKDRFNGWMRQAFDQDVDSQEDGGKVWEHWCTLRDLRPGDALSASVLKAYVSLIAILGDKFIATVARGRRDYAHPKQLCALVKAGLVREASAICDIQPSIIPLPVERLFLEANPELSLQAVKQLSWSDPPRYYMFHRRASRWVTGESVKMALGSI